MKKLIAVVAFLAVANFALGYSNRKDLFNPPS